MRIIDSLFKKSGINEKIESFDVILLHLSGMRMTMEYELVMNGGEAALTLYTFRYREGGHERIPEKSAVCTAEEVLRLVNNCDVLRWDGFHGAHPRGVLDGTMFRLTATVNGGRQIFADGSQNFPKHFHDFEDGLRALLDRADAKE